jgi:DNA-binding transcriptional LysR family regulator
MTNVLAHLNALRSFEAAARHGSFTRAAQELCVTQAAVSHQIRQLEDALGAPLFERSHRRVALTDAGQRLFSTVSMAMHSIEHTLRDIRERGQTQPTLTVLVTPSLGARWLARRLHRFWTTNPEIDLHIYHALPHEQYALRRVDLAIRWGYGNCLPTERSEVLLKCELVPVCAPGYLRPDQPLRIPSDLRHYTLLHEDSYADWSTWFQAAGVGEALPAHGTIINDSNTLIEAALNQQGVALVRIQLIQDEIRSGALIQPFDVSIRCDGAYYLVYEKAAERRDAFRKFREFLFSEVSTTARAAVGA